MTREQRARTVECPKCEAKIGKFCISMNNKPLADAHASRRRVAENLAKEGVKP